MYRRVVFAAVHSHSFAEAAESLAELSETSLLPKRIWHAATHEADPAPLLPASFADPGRMRQIAQEIKGFTAPEKSPQSAATALAEAETPPVDERPGRPEVLVKSVVASTAKVAEFGGQL